MTAVSETLKGATEIVLQPKCFELGLTKPGRRKTDKQVYLWTNDVI